MIRVCHIITGLAADGAERMLFNLVTRMDRSRFQNDVISLTTTGDLGPSLTQAGIGVQALGLSAKAGSVAALCDLSRRLRQSPPDVVQTWMYHADLIGGVVAQCSGVRRVIWGVHHANLDWRQNNGLTVAIAKACALLSRAVPRRIVYCSESARVAHQRFGYANDRTDWIPNGFNTERFRPDPVARQQFRQDIGARESDVLIGLASRFHPQKDHANFLAAAERVLAQYPEAYFVLCGRDVSAEQPALATLLARYRLKDRVRLLGPLAETERFFGAMDVAVSSSRTEAFPLAVGEAMSCGVPCAVTDVGDSALLVGETGTTAPARDAAALASAIGTLLAIGPAGRAKLGENARRWIRERFSLDSVVGRYQDLYVEAMRH